MGIVLVAVGTFTAAPELRRPIRAAASAVSSFARALLRRRRGVVVTPDSGRIELRADPPSIIIRLDVEAERWREHVRDLLAQLQERVETLELQVEANQSALVEALSDLRAELLERVGIEIESADARHIVSRLVGALAIIAGSALLALAPYVD